MNARCVADLLAWLALAAVMLGPGEPGCSPTVPTACGEVDCADRECGPSPTCEGSCGTCLDGEVCNADGLCDVAPVCEPGYADCVDGLSLVCLDDGSAWADPLPCNPNGTPPFSFDLIGDLGRCDDRTCVTVTRGGEVPLSALIRNHDPYRNVVIHLETYGSPADTYPRAPGAWFDIPEPDIDIPWLGRDTIPFAVAVPADAAPGLYLTGLRAVLMNYYSSGGGVTLRLAIGHSLLIEVI